MSAHTVLLQMMLCLHLRTVELYGTSALPQLFVDTPGISDRYSLKNLAVFVQTKVLDLNTISGYVLSNHLENAGGAGKACYGKAFLSPKLRALPSNGVHLWFSWGRNDL